VILVFCWKLQVIWIFYRNGHATLIFPGVSDAARHKFVGEVHHEIVEEISLVTLSFGLTTPAFRAIVDGISLVTLRFDMTVLAFRAIFGDISLVISSFDMIVLAFQAISGEISLVT